MLTIRHSDSATLLIPTPWFHPPRSFVKFLVILLSLGSLATTQDTVNVSIPLSSPQIVYTPFVCNATETTANPQACAGAWQILNSQDPTQPTVSTSGPSPVSSNIIPQMFFQFRASGVIFTILPSSNATVNITISAAGLVVSQTFDSTVGSASIVNLPKNDVALLTLTVIPETPATRFDLGSLTITVPADAPISSVLPAPTLPPSASLPVFSLTSTSTGSTSPSPTVPQAAIHTSNKMIAEAVGLTVGLGLGLTALAAIAFYYWKRKRRRLRSRDIPMEETGSEWTGNDVRLRDR